MRIRTSRPMTAIAAIFAVAGCGFAVSGYAPPRASTSGPGAGPATQTCVQQALAGMSTAQRVGQLIMAGVSSSAPTADQLDMIGTYHLGGVILDGNSSAGVDATAQVSKKLAAQATSDGVKLWISTDQEGGYVRRLTGPGFSPMPTALDQGKLSVRLLKADAQSWGAQLANAGVNMNLAPVLDTVPEDVGTANQPIGRYDREFGYTPSVVTSHGTAFSQGMRSSAVQTVGKHFPGLGRADGNTDTTAGVKDTVTTRDDPYLQPYQTAAADGIPLMMVSTAIYTKIDPDHVAAFSHTIVTGMLRGDAGFGGTIISDDLGQAKSVASFSAGQRAVKFLQAGGDVILTVKDSTVGPMINAVTDKANSDSGFADVVDAAVTHVLRTKDAAGMLPCDSSPDHHKRSADAAPAATTRLPLARTALALLD